MTQDHRTDLYSLGILFWTLLVGRGQMPFEGGPLELLHAIVQKRPMPVHEVRRDVPQVLANIVDKASSFILLIVLGFGAEIADNYPATREKSRFALPERAWSQS
jgi:serine/threonine protein kinase